MFATLINQPGAATSINACIFLHRIIIMNNCLVLSEEVDAARVHHRLLSACPSSTAWVTLLLVRKLEHNPERWRPALKYKQAKKYIILSYTVFSPQQMMI